MFKNLKKSRVVKLIMACVMILCSFQGFAESKNYYEILGVARNASYDEIKKAYRKQIRRWHPDLNPEITAEQSNQKSMEINEAWEVLGDDEKRSVYDEGGFVPLARPKSKLEEVIGIVARHRSDTREWREKRDLTFLVQFTTDEQIDALRAAAPYFRGGIRSHYADLLKFDDPRLVDRLKSALRAGGRHFAFSAFFKDELSKAMQTVASKVSFKDAEILMADLSRVQPRSNLERQALSEFIKQNQSQIFKLSPHESQLKELEKISGLSNLNVAYQKARTENGSQLEYDAMYRRLEAEKDQIRDRVAFDEMVAQARSPAQRNALNKFLIRNPSWIAQINQSGEQLRKLLEEKGYAEVFRREIAAQYLQHSGSLSDYLSLTGLSGLPDRRPWRNLIAVTVEEFLRLGPSLDDLQRVLKVKGLGASGLRLATAAIDQATTASELRTLEIPADYAESLEVKNRYRAKMSSFGKTETRKCFPTVADLLKKLTQSTKIGR